VGFNPLPCVTRFDGANESFITSLGAAMKLFHATKIENVPSILKDGLKCSLDGVYLSDTIKGAAKWKAGFVETSLDVVVVEVEIDGRKIRKGNDHSPLMQKKFGAGKSFLSHKSIPSKSVKRIHFCTLTKHKS
jgi:hypothetical protein